jgi:hydrogenase-4 component B
MSATLIVVAIALAGSSGLPGLFGRRAGARLFVAGMTLAALCACAAGALAFAGDTAELAAAWPVPGGRLAVQVDALSALFVIPIAAVPALGAWYGLEYWPGEGRKLRAFYGAVTAGMLLLVVARNAVLFLGGWEIMAASAFILVSTEDEQAAVREVGYLYLVATRLGTLCLFAMFALLGASAGTLDFAAWPRALAGPASDAIFALGLAGFGLKAGLMPLHVWLPGAHANAPSHVSALMSGVLIKTGIYGLVRLTAAAAAPPLWWAYALLGAGGVSGVLGVAFAIGQHDLKRLLAYHSVENIGIICLGLGAAVLGRALGRPELVALGLGGALLHVWNHGLFKGLLFLSAGAVVHATGTRAIDQLGGVLGRMPRTGLAFLVGAVAICGLPPLNGLVSELLVYLALFRTSSAGGAPWIAGALAAPALAAIGALAVACFVKVFGAVFLGAPRTPAAARAHDVGPTMLAPMAALAAGCAVIGLGAPLIGPLLDAAVAAWSGDAPRLATLAPLGAVSAASAGLLVVLALGALWMRTRAPVPAVVTWDCGYARPTARMQYTASSFAEMLVGLLGWALRPSVHAPRLDGPFPRAANFESHVPDTVLDRAIVPAFALAERLATRLRPLQRGSLHLYLLYILGALFALLLWR